jgi:hypothetical protein
VNFGECYYDHCVHYLKDPVRRSIFYPGDDTPTIQILVFEHVFKDCVVFCSLGLTHYFRKKFEIFMPVEGEEKEVLEVMAKILDSIVEKNIIIERGIFIRGLARLFPRFVEKYQKPAIYFTIPYGIPGSFAKVDCEGKQGEIFQAAFISETECNYLDMNGVEAFENLLELKEVDLYQLFRESCIES